MKKKNGEIIIKCWGNDMKKLICWFKTLYRSLHTFPSYPMSGHDFVDEEVDIRALVTTSKCEVCGKYEVYWESI